MQLTLTDLVFKSHGYQSQLPVPSSCLHSGNLATFPLFPQPVIEDCAVVACSCYTDGEQATERFGPLFVGLLALQVPPGAQSRCSGNSVKSCNTARHVAPGKGIFFFFKVGLTPLEILPLGVQEKSLHPFL